MLGVVRTNGKSAFVLSTQSVLTDNPLGRDVAAGIAILQEAGGLVTTANPPENPETADVPSVRLGSRLYLAVRPAGPSQSESARQGQERVVREVWRRVRTLDYARPGA